MAPVPPLLVAGVFGVLLVFTTYTYFFQIPTSLRSNTPAIGYWGKPDAEFNWCELDYQITDFVAEPVNTATGVLYILTAVGGWQLHRSHFDLEVRLLLNLVFLAMIGVGTVLFHATLRYNMQLLDELPIYYLILEGAWGLSERSRHLRHGLALPIAIAVWAACMTVVLQATPQQSTTHQTFRGIMTCTFSACFIYIFWAAARLAEQYRSMQDLFSWAFLWFVLAIVSWLADNGACDILQSLRWYPNLHAWGWHCGSVGGLYLMFLALLVQRQEVHGIHCEVAYIGYLPVVRPAAADKLK